MTKMCGSLQLGQGCPPKFEAQLSKRSVYKISTNSGVCSLQFERLTRMRGRSPSFLEREKDSGNTYFNVVLWRSRVKIDFQNEKWISI